MTSRRGSPASVAFLPAWSTPPASLRTGRNAGYFADASPPPVGRGLPDAHVSPGECLSPACPRAPVRASTWHPHRGYVSRRSGLRASPGQGPRSLRDSWKALPSSTPRPSVGSRPKAAFSAVRCWLCPSPSSRRFPPCVPRTRADALGAGHSAPPLCPAAR